jgi:hypothetical protein
MLALPPAAEGRPLPRYHFNIEDGADGANPDGIELESLARAKCEGVKLAGQAICDAAGTFWNQAQWKMTVTDDTGLSLFELLIIGTESAAGRSR